MTQNNNISTDISIKSTKIDSEYNGRKYVGYQTMINISKFGYEFTQSKDADWIDVRYFVSNKLNASSRAFRGITGKTFFSWDEIYNNYKRLRPYIEDIKLSHELVKLS